MNSWIADISLHKKIGKFITAFKDKEELMFKVRAAHVCTARAVSTIITITKLIAFSKTRACTAIQCQGSHEDVLRRHSPRKGFYAKGVRIV